MKHKIIRLLSIFMVVVGFANLSSGVGAYQVEQIAVTIDVEVLMEPESQVGDPVTISITIGNNAGEPLEYFTIKAGNGVFDHIDFLESSGVQVDGEDIAYTYKEDNGNGASLEIRLHDVPDGAERVVTYQGTLKNPTISSITHVYKMLGAVSRQSATSMRGTAISYVQSRKYTIAYDANGGAGTISDGSNPYKEMTNVRVLDGSNLIKPNFVFAGWNTQANGLGTTYAVGDIFPIGQNMILYAKWEALVTTYAVEHYLEQSDGTFQLTETEVLSKASGETVLATAKQYAGYSYNEKNVATVKSGKVAADGSLRLKLYYNRDHLTTISKPSIAPKASKGVVTTSQASIATKDTTNVTYYVFVALLSIVSIGLVISKKASNRQKQ